jgi:putative two-component system response regulator
LTRQAILFVDDDPMVLASYERSLRQKKQQWAMAFETCPHAAWSRLLREPFDAVVTDVRMPGMTGLQLLRLAKNNPATKSIVFVVVTGESDRGLKRQALNLDAADLLNKPIQLDDLVARIRSVLRTKHLADKLKEQNELLEQRVQERTAELAASRLDILWRLGKAAEYRDEETGNHVVRVASYSHLVAKALGLNDDYCSTLFLAAPLHDVGKIGVSDSILLKPGKLSGQEWIAMKRHCEMGYSILTDPCKFSNVVTRYSRSESSFCLDMRTKNPVIEMAASIAISHHEKWDGNGYPRGVSKDSIPIEGRIVAIADVYDALRSQRPYKKALPVSRSLEIVRDGAGSHFDPNVVDAFLGNLSEIEALEKSFQDGEDSHSLSELGFAAV